MRFYFAAGAPHPERKLSVKPRIIVTRCDLQDKARFAQYLFQIAFEPRELCPNRSDGRDALRLFGLHCQLASLDKQPRGIGVAATDSHVAEHRKSGNLRDSRYSIMAQHKPRIIRRTVPLALLEMRPRSPRRHVKFVRIKLVLCRVSNAFFKVDSRHTIIPVSYRGGSKVGHSASRMVLEVVVEREP